jgi:hypothetical protein
VKVATDIQAQKRRAEELRLKKLARLEVTKVPFLPLARSLSVLV